jgi:hypothetical protein
MIVFSSSSLDTSDHAGTLATAGGLDREEPFFLLCILAILIVLIKFHKGEGVMLTARWDKKLAPLCR